MRLLAAARGLSFVGALYALVGVKAVNDNRVTVAVSADASARHVSQDEWATDSSAARSFDAFHNAPFKTTDQEAEYHLAIGVKTSVLNGVAMREAIRNTWGGASIARSLGVRVWFVGCSPDLSALSDADRASAIETIALEKATYGDLLTHELWCEDSIAGLVGKTVEFMHFANSTISSETTKPSPAYVMMTDDDVYVRLDRLIELLKADVLPRERMYAGNAAMEAQRAPSPPERDPRSRFYVSHEAYPMSELPPFASGAHYILSHDMAEFIARNRDDLEGLDGLDDVTMALWMLALQVHPTFLDSFQLLPHGSCAEDLISFGGLSSTGVRQIHSNILNGHKLCAEFSTETWYNAVRNNTALYHARDTSAVEESIRFKWDIFHDPATASLQIQVDCEMDNQQASLLYLPSAGPHDAVFCAQLLKAVRQHFSAVLSPSLCARHRRLLQRFIAEQYTLIPPLRAKLEIARHNLARSEADEVTGVKSPVWTVAMSPQSTYARVLIECIFSRLYKSHHLAVLNEEGRPAHSPPPDVFVFSVLDEEMRFIHESDRLHLPPTGAAFVNKYGRVSRMLMVSGESWLPHQLHPQVTLLSTVASPQHTKHVYLPHAAAAFGEMVRHTPIELLRLSPVKFDIATRRFGAYLFSNCGVVYRERMFDLINAIEPTDALGYCQGASRTPDESRLSGRRSVFFADEAVDLYRQYKFVIAFENTLTALGYVTEKIVTAFLAGAVPIYCGHSESVSRIFNRDAFIDCGSFSSLQACADRVREVHNSPAEYEAMRSAPPITNLTAFQELFSWHPLVDEMREPEMDHSATSVVHQLEKLVM